MGNEDSRCRCRGQNVTPEHWELMYFGSQDEWFRWDFGTGTGTRRTRDLYTMQGTLISHTKMPVPNKRTFVSHTKMSVPNKILFSPKQGGESNIKENKGHYKRQRNSRRIVFPPPWRFFQSNKKNYNLPTY